MGEAFVFVLFAVVVLGIIVAWYFGHQQEKKRRAALAAWADNNGYVYTESRQYGIPRTFGYFDVLRQGDERYAYNVVTGQFEGLPFHMFDYHYETYSRDKDGNRQTHHHYLTATIIETGLKFPTELKVRPEGFFDKIAAAVGFNDIDFESNEFSKAFHVKSKDKKFAYDVIHQGMMEFLLRNKGNSFEIERNAICVVKGESRIAPELWEYQLGYAREVLENLPEYLIEQIKIPRRRQAKPA